MKDLLSHASYLTLDNDTIRTAMEVDALAQLELLSERARAQALPVVIDEVQRVPAIALALKQIVDEHGQPGQFVLTGSSDIFARAKAGDTLAGRTFDMTLYPFSSAEVLGAQPCRLLDLAYEHKSGVFKSLPEAEKYTRADAIDRIVRGGYDVSP